MRDGHNINNCLHLKYTIEILIQRGKLKQNTITNRNSTIGRKTYLEFHQSQGVIDVDALALTNVKEEDEVRPIPLTNDVSREKNLKPCENIYTITNVFVKPFSRSQENFIF